MTFGTKIEGVDYLDKNSAKALIYNPFTQKFIILKYADGTHSLAGGTLKEAENMDAALKREIAEETGYINFQIYPLGEPIITFDQHLKDSKYYKYTHNGFLLVLNDLTQIPQKLEEDELGVSLVELTISEILEIFETQQQVGDHWRSELSRRGADLLESLKLTL